jgi:hypothetical protein|tara:strand:- start:873 stop:1643 length:771 start_codon:yes stop_codon:yes gene_type:complete
MATVRMSNKLTVDLCKEYEKSYENTKPKPEYPASLGDAIYDTHVKPIIDRIKEASKLDDVEFFDLSQDSDDSFFINDSELNVQFETKCYDQTDRPSGYDDLPWELQNLVKEYECVIDTPEIHTANMPLSVEQPLIKGSSYRSQLAFNLYKAPQDEAVIKALEISKERHMYDINKQNEIAKFAKMLLRFQTLNQALKAWPGGALAAMVQKVDPDKMVTIHKKTERKAKAVQDKGFVEQHAGDFNAVILGSTLLGDND